MSLPSWVREGSQGRPRRAACTCSWGGAGTVCSAALRKGWRGGVGPPELQQSALQGSSFLGQQPKSRPLQAGMLGNTGEHREPEKCLPPWAVGTLERPALWVSRVLLDGLFPGGKRELRILSSPPRKLSCGAFPSFPGAWGGSGEGGGVRRTCAQARLPANSVREEGKGGLVPLPHDSLFQRNQDPPTSDSPHITRRHGNGHACNGANTPIACYRPSVCVCVVVGEGTVLLRPQAF